MQVLGGTGQVLAANRKPGQLQQSFDPGRLGAGRQLEVIEGLRVVLLIAVEVGPVALDLGPVVRGSVLGEVAAFLELGLGVAVPADVGQRLTVKRAGQCRAGGRLDGAGAVPRRRLEVAVPVFDPGQDRQDKAVVRR